MVTIRRIVSIRIPKTHHISPRDTQTVAMAIPFVFTGDFPNDDVGKILGMFQPRHVPVHIPEVTLETAEYLHVAGHCGTDVVMQRR
jgi:hypothetical protein